MGVTIAQWRPEYATGDNLVDEQHQSLFSTINALNNAMLIGQGEILLEKTLQSLKDYTTIHFDTEEQFMLRHQYPGYANHKQQHEALKAKVLEFEHQHQQDLGQLTREVSHFLTDWLIHHIKDEDQKMIRFCRQGSEDAEAVGWSDGTESASRDRAITNNATASTSSMIAHWRPEYETGYAIIDDQHQSLFHAINALHSAMLAGRAEDLLDRTLKSLRNYTTIHFETEEQFMLQYGYSGYAEHKTKHDALRQQVDELYQQMKQQSAAKLAITVSHFLTDWLINHIKSEDQKLITFLRRERQREEANKLRAQH